MSMTGQKQLSKEFSLIGGTWNGLAWTFNTAPGWTEYISGMNTFLYQKTFIDLSGMTLEDLTIQLDGVANQRAYEPVIGGAFGETWAAPVQLNVWITSDAIDMEGALTAAALGNYPGMLDSELDWTNLMFGETITFSSNSNVGLSSNGFMAPLYTKLYGSNEPSANSKLHVYVAWRIGSDAAVGLASATLPELRIAMAANIFEEKELAYLERQRRSYVQ